MYKTSFPIFPPNSALQTIRKNIIYFLWLIDLLIWPLYISCHINFLFYLALPFSFGLVFFLFHCCISHLLSHFILFRIFFAHHILLKPTNSLTSSTSLYAFIFLYFIFSFSFSFLLCVKIRSPKEQERSSIYWRFEIFFLQLFIYFCSSLFQLICSFFCAPYLRRGWRFVLILFLLKVEVHGFLLLLLLPFFDTWNRSGLDWG